MRRASPSSVRMASDVTVPDLLKQTEQLKLLSTVRQRRRPEGGGVRTHALICCLPSSFLTIGRASLSRRSTVPTPSRRHLQHLGAGGGLGCREKVAVPCSSAERTPAENNVHEGVPGTIVVGVAVTRALEVFTVLDCTDMALGAFALYGYQVQVITFSVQVVVLAAHFVRQPVVFYTLYDDLSLFVRLDARTRVGDASSLILFTFAV